MGYKVDDSQHQDFVIDLGGLKEVAAMPSTAGRSTTTLGTSGTCVITPFRIWMIAANGRWRLTPRMNFPVRMTLLPATPGRGLLTGPWWRAKLSSPSGVGAAGCSSSELQVFGVAEEPEVYENKALNRPYEKSEPYMEDGRYSYRTPMTPN